MGKAVFCIPLLAGMPCENLQNKHSVLLIPLQWYVVSRRNDIKYRIISKQTKNAN